MSNFLENLKNAADNGEFNSDAAKKINEIDEKANDFTKMKTTEQMEESLTEKALEVGIKTVSEEDVAKLNSEYEEKMKIRAKEEILLATVVTMINMDEEINGKVEELRLFIADQKKQFDPEDDVHKELYKKIDELTFNYGFNVKE